MRKLITLVILGISVCSCTNFKAKEFNHIKQERDSLLSILNQNKANLNKQIVSFLTFQEDNAEEAMNFYVELFDNS